MDLETLSTDTSDTAASKLVEKAFQHWEARRRTDAAEPHIEPTIPHAFSIALSREAGTQGTAVAQEVGRLLGWQVYDRQLLEKIAQDMGLRTNLLESVDERRQSWLTEAMEALMSVSFASESGFTNHLEWWRAGAAFSGHRDKMSRGFHAVVGDAAHYLKQIALEATRKLWPRPACS
jgi:hypothetical protein